MKIALILLTVISLATTVHAGNSVFSADGKSIYLVPLNEGSGLYHIDLTTGKQQSMRPILNLGKDVIKAVARNAAGEILLCTGKAIWKWQGKAGTAQKWLDLPADFSCRDFSCTMGKGAVPAGTVFLHGTRESEQSFSLMTWSTTQKKWFGAYCRRNEPYSAPQTNNDGRMFFASDSDLWEGTMIPETDDSPEMTIAGSIEGCRIAPLAMMNADNGNSGSMLVGEVVVAGTKVYSLLQGVHMGALLETPAPAKPLYANEESNEHPELATQYKIMQESLAQTKIHYSGGPCDALSVYEKSPADYLVFWRQDHEGERAWMLMKANDQAKKIGTEPEE